MANVKLKLGLLGFSRRIFSWAIVLILFLSSWAAAQNIKMTVGQTGTNPGTSLFFIAKKENLYAKHGLDVNIIPTSTSAAVQAMLGGSMQLSTGSGAAAFATATLEGAPPFVLVSSWINVFPYTVMVHKDIKRPEDLKGKTGHVGAPFGTIPDVALRFALAKLGLDPEKDVKLIQLPRPDTANIVAQLERGDVQFGPLPPPFDRIAQKRGFHSLISLPELGIPWQNNGEWVQRAYLQKNRDTVLRFVRATADALKFYYEQKDKTVAYLMEFLGSNREDTDYAYEAFKKWGDRTPKPQIGGIQTTFEAIKRKTPKAATADPAFFIDTSLVDQLIREGYFK
ncbi:MAG: ABC transporter substrate-binding protein [Deltaproteobacteria bacterium]|nr:ABC transporter substrate-binding protein [Deltaproteobacteria bacterium]